MNCDADLLNIDAHEALCEVNKLLTPVILHQEIGNQEEIVVHVRDYDACLVTPYRSGERVGGISIIEFLSLNNIGTVAGRKIRFAK